MQSPQRKRICAKPGDFLADMAALVGAIKAEVDFASTDSRAGSKDAAIRRQLASVEGSTLYDDNDCWAIWQMNIGVGYFRRKNGQRRSNLKVAIKHLVEASKVLTESKHPHEWAETHQCLAVSYFGLFNRQSASLAEMSEDQFAEQSALLEKCIASCANALQVFTPAYSALSWGLMIECLATVYTIRLAGDRAENVETAIKHGTTALRGMEEILLFSPTTMYSRKWRLRAHRTLADAYNFRVVGAREDNIEHVIHHLTKAVKSISIQVPGSTTDHFGKGPLDGCAGTWSERMTELGSAYGERVKGNRSENLRISMECHARSDEVKDWEDPTNDTGLILRLILKIEFHFHKLIRKLFHRALVNGELEFASREADPQNWAENRIHAADKYLKLVNAAKRKANMEKVIVHYLAAAEVLTKEEFPERWAYIQMNLCDAYLQRVEGVRRENMENAMKCFNAGNEVRGDDTLPADWLKQQWEKGAVARRRDAVMTG